MGPNPYGKFPYKKRPIWAQRYMERRMPYEDT